MIPLMAFGRRQDNALEFRRSARQDVRAWAMLLIGAIFVGASLSVDPAKNCGDSGECAPWLIPIGFVMGAAVGLGGLGQLLANPNRGSRFDSEIGALIWWQRRYGTSGGDEGQIEPRSIGLVRIVKVSERSDEVHMYDLDGNRQSYFDEEVIPTDQENWTKSLIARWPHIRFEIVESR
jgi:hypothetical protein